MNSSSVETIAEKLFSMAPATVRPGLVHGVALGDAGSLQGGAPTAASTVVLVDIAAAGCEVNEIARIAAGATILYSGGFTGLAAAASAVAISTDSPSQGNVPAFCTGTLSGIVEASGTRYALGSNHVLAFNRRVALASRVLSPGLGDDTTGGSVVGAVSHVVPFERPFDFQPPAYAEVDCALATTFTNVSGTVVTPGAAAIGDVVEKLGRTTNTTTGTVRLTGWMGPVDFSLGTHYFQGLSGGLSPAASPFAAPGDSGAMVRLAAGAANTGVGLLMARAYAFDAQRRFIGFLSLWCSLERVVALLTAQLGGGAVTVSRVP